MSRSAGMGALPLLEALTCHIVVPIPDPLLSPPPHAFTVPIQDMPVQYRARQAVGRLRLATTGSKAAIEQGVLEWCSSRSAQDTRGWLDGGIADLAPPHQSGRPLSCRAHAWGGGGGQNFNVLANPRRIPGEDFDRGCTEKLNGCHRRSEQQGIRPKRGQMFTFDCKCPQHPTLVSGNVADGFFSRDDLALLQVVDEQANSAATAAPDETATAPSFLDVPDNDLLAKILDSEIACLHPFIHSPRFLRTQHWRWTVFRGYPRSPAMETKESRCGPAGPIDVVSRLQLV